MIQNDSVHLKTFNNRYHIFVLPINPYYLQYNSNQFGLVEEYDDMPRVCMWLTREDIFKFKVHPRCKPFLELILS